MRSLWALVVVSAAVAVVLVRVGDYGVQALPHRSIEETEEDVDQETEEDTSSDTEHKVAVTPSPDQGSVAGEVNSSSLVLRELTHPPVSEGDNVRPMTGHSHEGESQEDERQTEDEEQRNTSSSDEDDSVEFPRTEALCPVRPQEISMVEQECAKEYQQWKEAKAKKETTPTTTDPPQVMMVMTVDMTSKPGQTTSTSDEPMNADMKMPSTEEPLTTTIMEEMTTVTTTAATDADGVDDDDDTMTSMANAEPETTMAAMTMTEAATATTSAWMTVTTDVTEPIMGRRKRTVQKRKRSCYPATCILRKLKLLDTMSQLNSKQIQKFAMNMTSYGSSNLEEKAVECVKEINDAMIDSTSDIGKKVGCVAYKVITCLNKGLACPIIKVPQN